MTLTVVWRGLMSAADEAGLTLRRTAFSPAIRTARDFSVGIFDQFGTMLLQGNFSPGHLGAMPSVLEHVNEAYPPETLREGDAIFLNDLYMGSGHLLDCFLVSPVYHVGVHSGYIVSCAHMVDIGGAVPGSQAVEGINEFYQEGIRFLPTRMWKEGEAVPEVMGVLAANVRLPDIVLGDVRALRHSNLAGARRLGEVISEFGLEQYQSACTELLAVSEQKMRDGIREWPDGVYEATDYYDDCGPGTPALRIQLSMTVDGDELHLDYTGSSEQTKSGINAVKNYLDSYCLFAMKVAMDSGELPQNAGSIRPMRIECPPGSVMNASPPAGAGARAIMQQRIVDVMMQALMQVVPTRAMGCSSQWGNPIVSGLDPGTGERFMHYEVMVGGLGGRWASDGLESMAGSFNIDGMPVEISEAWSPVVIERMELIPDSAGAGRHRGGHAVRKDIRVHGQDLLMTNLGERHKFAPKGFLGGLDGTLARTVLNPDTPGERDLESKGHYELADGDIVSLRVSGAGGYGDPRERDRALIERDLRRGLLTPEAAARVYGYSER